MGDGPCAIKRNAIIPVTQSGGTEVASGCKKKSALAVLYGDKFVL